MNDNRKAFALLWQQYASSEIDSDLPKWRVITAPERWYPVEGTFHMGPTGKCMNLEFVHDDAMKQALINRGLTRNTVTQIDVLAKKIRTISRMSAWLDEHGNDKGVTKTFYIVSIGDTWKCIQGISSFHPEVIYMSKATGDKLCKLLNEGSVVF